MRNAFSPKRFAVLNGWAAQRNGQVGHGRKEAQREKKESMRMGARSQPRDLSGRCGAQLARGAQRVECALPLSRAKETARARHAMAARARGKAGRDGAGRGGARQRGVNSRGARHPRLPPLTARTCRAPTWYWYKPCAVCAPTWACRARTRCAQARCSGRRRCRPPSLCS